MKSLDLGGLAYLESCPSRAEGTFQMNNSAHSGRNTVSAADLGPDVPGGAGSGVRDDAHDRRGPGPICAGPVEPRPPGVTAWQLGTTQPRKTAPRPTPQAATSQAPKIEESPWEAMSRGPGACYTWRLVVDNHRPHTAVHFSIASVLAATFDE